MPPSATRCKSRYSSVSGVKDQPASWPQIYICVGLTSLATLLFELSLTRIFSVVFYYHFAFLAISIALFGLGVGGVLSYVVSEWRKPFAYKLGAISLANSGLIALALAAILGQGNQISPWDYALIYFTTSLPFVASGIILSLTVSETIERVNRVYFFDLAGAACGCMVLWPLLGLLDGPSAVVSAGAIFAAAAAIWFTLASSLRGRVASVALALTLVAFLTYNKHQDLIGIRHAKEHTLANEVFVKWNSFSRIAIEHDPAGSDSIRIDADAQTGIFDYDLSHLEPEQRRGVLYNGPALPYAIRPGAKALIIGSGGGWDVARALASGSHDITAVEINPIIARTIMQQRFPDLSRGLYLRPDVHVVVEDGRSYVRRSQDRYQVIQATLVDTWASTAAGAFALTENNLYTSDAVRDYLTHLSPDGLVAFTRWGFDPPRESLRLVSLAMRALDQMGVGGAAARVIVGRKGSVQGWGAQDTVLIARNPFTAADIDRAQACLRDSGMEAVYYPGSSLENPFRQLLLSPDPAGYERDYRFDISPVTDNRPFFFYTVQPRDLAEFMSAASKKAADYNAVNRAVPLLFGLMGISLAATLLILILPPLVLRTRLPGRRGVRVFLLYFLFVGAGYILIEVALIQKFVLFLGQPIYALTVVIFSMLASSGLGSAFSQRFIGPREGRLIKALGCVALLAALLALVATQTMSALLWLPITLKIALTVAMIAPLGFTMGMPFPAALRRLEEWHAPSVRWAWSLNAASSVLGSVGALMCAIYLGLAQTLIIGGLFYLAAMAVVARVNLNAASEPQPGTGRVMLAS
jgi:predicted membrane-bound spermidine synthase